MTLKRLSRAIILLLSIFFALAYSLSGQPRAYLNYAIFNSLEKGPYIETYLAIDGSEITYTAVDSLNLQGGVNISIIFSQDEKIVEFDKYDLRSPLLKKAKNIEFEFIDQQRYFLPEGFYNLELKIKDMSKDNEVRQITHPFEVDFTDDKVCFSGIQLVDSVAPTVEENILTKSGYDLFPHIFNFYPDRCNKLSFYTEIYNTEKILGADGKFLVVCFIKSFDAETILDGYVSYKRAEARDIFVYLNEYDISKLPTGNYVLQLEARDVDNNILSENSLFFQRNNPDLEFSESELAGLNVENTFAGGIDEVDSLDECIRCLYPRSTSMEKNFINKKLETTDILTKQKFLYRFWYIRNRANPEEAWMQYLEMVEIVNQVYKTQVHKGYETDRGRVYLKYGPPNIITESYNEPSSYPYEIWQYYQLGMGQSNKRFVFYTTDLITNNFQLLHSDAIGEISNHRWEVVLNSRWFDPLNIDAVKTPEIWGGNATKYYLNPR